MSGPSGRGKENRRSGYDLEKREASCPIGAARTKGKCFSAAIPDRYRSDSGRYNRTRTRFFVVGGRGKGQSLSFLLDTHILLYWFSGSSHLTARESRIVDEASAESPLLLAGISLWEIATLYGLGRITLGLPLREWLERAAAPPLVRVVGISPAIAAAVAALPQTFHRDPADRIIVATAQLSAATLLTRDRRIIEAGVVATAG